MPQRSPEAYLSDIVESCDAIASAISGLTLSLYEANRLVRSSVEREFIIIGEAVGALSRVAPEIFDSVPHARRIVDFRNLLTHEYQTVDDAVVWVIAERDAPRLHEECNRFLCAIRLPPDSSL